MEYIKSKKPLTKEGENIRLDCEIISQDFLPVLRAVLAKELSADGMSQKEVADVLGISQPAVSQYLRDLRGARNHFSSDEELFSRVKNMCRKIKTNEIGGTELKKEMYAVCEAAMNKKKM